MQNASSCSISDSLVTIEMSGKMRANSGPGRIWNLLATTHLKGSYSMKVSCISVGGTVAWDAYLGQLACLLA